MQKFYENRQFHLLQVLCREGFIPREHPLYRMGQQMQKFEQLESTVTAMQQLQQAPPPPASPAPNDMGGLIQGLNTALSSMDPDSRRKLLELARTMQERK